MGFSGGNAWGNTQCGTRVGVSVVPTEVVEPNAAEAGSWLGYYDCKVGDRVLSRPRIDLELARRLRESTTDEDPAAMAAMVARHPDYSWRQTFQDSFKVIPGAGHGSVPHAVQRFPGLTSRSLASMGKAAQDALSLYDNTDAEVKRRQTAAEAEAARKAAAVKTYLLSSVYHDTTFQQKYGLSTAFLQVVYRHAVGNAQRACEVLTSYLHDAGHTDVKVVPGDYAQGGKPARRAVLAATKAFAGVALSGNVLIIAGELYIEELVSSGQRPTWTVAAPLAEAVAAAAVARMVTRCGPGTVQQMLTQPLIRLGIRIHEEGGSPSAICEPHAGPLVGLRGGEVVPVDVSPVALLPVMAEGSVVGTAVRVTGTTALISAHVASRFTVGALRIGGGGVTRLRQAGRDSELVVHVPIPMHGAVCRVDEPVVGRRHRVYYHDGECVRRSEALLITSCEVDGVVMTALSTVLGPGCSGGALVEENTGKLVATYFGASTSAGVCYSVDGTALLGDGVTAAPAAGGNQLYMALAARGLAGRLHAVAASTLGLYNGEACVGTGFSLPGGVVTTASARYWTYKYADGTVCSPVDEAAHGCDRLPSHGNVFTGPARNPIVGEQVTFMARGKDGVYMSVPLEVQRAVGHTYTVAYPGGTPTPLAGAVGIALSDGAVVCLHAGAIDTEHGLRVKAVSVPVTGAAKLVAGTAALCAALAPMDVAAWAESTRSSLFGELTDVTEVRASVARACLSPTTAAEVVDAVKNGGGLAAALRSQFPKDTSDQFTTRVLAVIGAGFVCERVSRVNEFVREFTGKTRPASWHAGDTLHDEGSRRTLSSGSVEAL